MQPLTFTQRASRRVKLWWSGRSSAFRAAAVTGFWAFVGPFIATVTPFLASLQAWLSGDAVEFPDVKLLGKAAMAGFGAVLGLAGNYLHRRVKPPSYDPNQQPHIGDVTVR